MISVQTIVDRMNFVLDAEDSERYTFENDYKLAINSSVEWLQAIFNKAFADKKLTEEDLKELIKTTVFQTSQFSRIHFESIDDSVWTILKVNPEPVLFPDTATITPSSNPQQSINRDDLLYVSSKFAAKLLSTEQWEENVDNVFEAGNERLLGSFKSYAYLNYSTYVSTGNPSKGTEIEVRPSIPNEFLGVTYLKYPTPITDIEDSIEFPENLTNLVYEKALNFISWKQGDNTNLYTVTNSDVMTLAKLMI